MDEKTTKKLSRLLSRILRHKPQMVGVTLDKQGFCLIQDLLDGINHRYRYNDLGYMVDISHIEFVVVHNDKKRFEIKDNTIRAVQGHSTDQVDRDFEQKTPPNPLYHGTARIYLQSIKNQGLLPQRRHYVHLSADVLSARKVGARHGKVRILKIDTQKMLDDGFVFYQAENGVWLTCAVPPNYLTTYDGQTLDSLPVYLPKKRKKPKKESAMTVFNPPLSERANANAIRVLAMDAVQQANSGHPGAPMGMADIAEVLWRKFLKHNPKDPNWLNRDRFVLSNGHGSMLQYALLHLSGYDVSIDDLKSFRQLHSKTPGHPEYGYTAGVETTTGPLGQGLANAVGFAIAEKTLASQFNQDGFEIINHHTYCFVGDGCLMEGISHEVCSLAGTLNLGKLIVYYDDNGISIDGEVEGWFSDDTQKRFESYGWQVQKIDGHDSNAISQATQNAINETQKPSLIICKTVIGAGSPNKQGKEDCHGSPLGADEIVLTRETLAWTDKAFEIPQTIYDAWNGIAKGETLQGNWQADFDNYKKAYPQLAKELLRRMSGDLPDDFEQKATAFIKDCQANPENIATRKASQNAINALQPLLPELLGGSADLAGSNLTWFKKAKALETDPAGNYIHYGVREFGMTAIANGIALHGGFVPYVATFLMFMEYARNAVRMSALMKQRVLHIYTHDSIGLGEDGPTHQPIEQLASLRATPNLHTWRPCDTVESAVAWVQAIKAKTTPSALIFSRQNLPHQARDDEQVAGIAKGGYVLAKEKGELQAIIIATGSEIALAMSAYDTLSDEGVGVRVVSMPCAEVFVKQDKVYIESVLPSAIRARVAVEASHTDYWYKFVGLDGKVIGMTTFGESAPAKDLFKHFGFTVENVVNAVKEVM